jgi:hypothetical protein
LVEVIDVVIAGRVSGPGFWSYSGHGEESTAEREFFGSAAVAEKTVIADALKGLRQDMNEKSAHELCGRQCHGFLMVVAIILPVKADLLVFPDEDSQLGEEDIHQAPSVPHSNSLQNRSTLRILSALRILFLVARSS